MLPARAGSDGDPTGPMVGAHREIRRLVRLYGGLLDALPAHGRAVGADDRRELRRVLYGLHAVLRLHFAQEEEAYADLDPGGDTSDLSAMLDHDPPAVTVDAPPRGR